MGSMMVKKGVNAMLNRLVKDEPDYNQPSTFMIGVTTTDPAWADDLLNDRVDIIRGFKTKTLQSITINETDTKMVFSGWLSVTEGNGNLLTGFAVTNDNYSDVEVDPDDVLVVDDEDRYTLITKSKFTGVSKTNTKLIKFNVTVIIQDSEEYTP